jgi:hypothetical protein
VEFDHGGAARLLVQAIDILRDDQIDAAQACSMRASA